MFIKHLEEFHYEIPIYLIAVSLLFMFSLRSSYVIGWDVNLEYKVFWLTESRQFWSMANYPDPYNACLSVTILPTIFQYFTKIDGAFVYKILFQCLAGLLSVTLYFIARNFANRFLSFLSAILFMSTVGFFLELPDLNRQEIAYLFFGLRLLTLFHKKITLLMYELVITHLCPFGNYRTHTEKNFLEETPTKTKTMEKHYHHFAIKIRNSFWKFMKIDSFSHVINCRILFL